MHPGARSVDLQILFEVDVQDSVGACRGGASVVVR